MKFSTIIPLYNKQTTIRRAIYSVFNQIGIDDKDLEIIIINDGSTDTSLTKVTRIQKENPTRKIIIHSQKNAGVSAARNMGIALATHEHLTFLDADDTYTSNFLSEISTLSQMFPNAAMLSTAYRFVNAQTHATREANLTGLNNNTRQRLEDYFRSAAYGDLPITASTVCIKKPALQGLGGFPINENMGEDQTVWSQLALKHPIAISKKIGANYYEHITDSLMQSVAPKQEMPFSRRLQHQLDKKLLPYQIQKSVKTYIAGHLLDLVRRNINVGDLKSAKRIIRDQRTQKQFARWVYWQLILIKHDLSEHLRISAEHSHNN